MPQTACVKFDLIIGLQNSGSTSPLENNARQECAKERGALGCPSRLHEAITQNPTGIGRVQLISYRRARQDD